MSSCELTNLSRVFRGGGAGAFFIAEGLGRCCCCNGEEEDAAAALAFTGPLRGESGKLKRACKGRPSRDFEDIALLLLPSDDDATLRDDLRGTTSFLRTLLPLLSPPRMLLLRSPSPALSSNGVNGGGKGASRERPGTFSLDFEEGFSPSLDNRSPSLWIRK